MKSYARVLSKLWCQPIMLTDQAIFSFSRLLDSRLAQTYQPGNGTARPKAESVSSKLSALIPGAAAAGVALIPIDGVIDKHMSLLDMECYGGCDLDNVDAALHAADQDPAIENILLVVDSPGGSVTGVPETAALVAEISARKNVFAFTDSMMCSSAYFIASAADQILATPSACVGSIGVRMLLLDESEALTRAGMKVESIESGKFKTSGMSFKPLQAEERAMFQDQITQLFQMFTETVTQKREVAAETMQGQVFFGVKALEAGLIDAIVPDLQAALAQF